LSDGGAWFSGSGLRRLLRCRGGVALFGAAQVFQVTAYWFGVVHRQQRLQGAAEDDFPLVENAAAEQAARQAGGERGPLPLFAAGQPYNLVHPQGVTL
jgi:hypothetical protein